MIRESISPYFLAEQTSVALSIVKDIRARYNNLADPTRDKKIHHDDVRDLLERFNPVIARRDETDKKGIINQVFYAASRLPQEIFTSSNNIVIRFNDDPNFFIDESGQKNPDTKTARDRKRWYKSEEVIRQENGFPVKKTILTIHAQSQTAVIETMTHISIVEQLRQKVNELIRQKVNELTHDVSKVELSQKEITFLWKIAGLLIRNGKMGDGPKIGAWANNNIEFESGERIANWDNLKSGENESKTAVSLAKKTEETLRNLKSPSSIIFANDYSLANILSHYLLNEKKGEVTVRDLIIDKALEAWERYKKTGFTFVQQTAKSGKLNRGRMNTKTTRVWNAKSPLEILGESLNGLKLADAKKRGIKLSDQVQFIVDNMIIFDLTKDISDSTTGVEVIDAFVRDFKNPQRLGKLGIKTLIEGDHSPTADSLYYIDFSKIDDSIISGLNPIIRVAVGAMKEKKQSAIYLPYAPGDLTYSIIKEMKRRIPTIQSVVEIGKVAHYVSGSDQRNISEIGQIVRPVKTFSSFGSGGVEDFNNGVKRRHIEPFETVRKIEETVLMQVPSVILQDDTDIPDLVKKILEGQEHKRHITLNMEVESFRRVAALGLKVYEVDYISDHAISQSIINEFISQGRDKLFQQITKSLARKGRHGVHAATAAVLLALAENS